MTDAEALARIERLRPIATRLGVSMAQLAIAWCTRHPMVSSVITGASRPEQVTENFAAIQLIDAIDDELDAEIRAAVG